MAQVTNRIPLEEARDLLDAPGRACLSFVVGGEPRVVPVRFRHEDGRFLVGLDGGGPRPADGVEVVLVVDEGVLFFDLRAVYVRGHLAPVPGSGAGSPEGYEVEASTVTCWDYGRLRAERGHA